MRHAYPILLDVSGRTIVIVGGGPVAARKARGLLDAGAATVRCVAPAFCDELPAAVERVTGAYRPDCLDAASLVFAATDQADVNDAVLRDARARNLWANRADVDEEEPGDFVVPARLRRGEVTVAVSAASPALAALIRDRLDASFDARWEQMASAMRELRPWIKYTTPDIAARRTLFRALATDEALTVLADRGAAGIRDWLLARHPELNHVR